MRLLMVGQLNGQLATASRMAADAGARVSHAVDHNAGMAILRERGADLIMIDVALDVATFIAQLRSERIARTLLPAASVRMHVPRSRQSRPAPRNMCRYRRMPSSLQR